MRNLQRALYPSNHLETESYFSSSRLPWIRRTPSCLSLLSIKIADIHRHIQIKLSGILIMYTMNFPNIVPDPSSLTGFCPWSNNFLPPLLVLQFLRRQGWPRHMKYPVVQSVQKTVHYSVSLQAYACGSCDSTSHIGERWLDSLWGPGTRLLHWSRRAHRSVL